MEMKHFPTINLEATGKHIAELRKEKGLSVKDLQRFFGFDAPQAIYKWQCGTTLPSVDNLLALSVLLEVSIDSILVTTQPNSAVMTDREPEGSVFFIPLALSGFSIFPFSKERFDESVQEKKWYIPCLSRFFALADKEYCKKGSPLVQ